MITVKPVLGGHSKRRPKLVFKTDYLLMQVKSIAECSKKEHSAILSTFIKLPFVFKIFVLSNFEWLLKTGFTVPYWLVQKCLLRIPPSSCSFQSEVPPVAVQAEKGKTSTLYSPLFVTIFFMNIHAKLHPQ